MRDEGIDPAVLHGAFESVGMPVLLLDGTFRVRAVNDAGVAFVGYDRETLRGAPARTVLAENEKLETIRRRLEAGEEWDGDIRLRTADGRTVQGQASVAPIGLSVGADGGTTQAAGESGDSRTRRPAYVAAFVDARQKRQYENAAEVLDRLLRHDLRNGLNLVYGYIQQARSQVDDEAARKRLADARHTLSDVLDKSDRARDLRQLLDRAYEQPTYPVRLDRVVENCADRLDGAYADATVETESLPSVTVAADELLSDVLEGLIENGIVHDDGEPRVTVAVERTETTGIVRVTDRGPGIPDHEADHVFRRGQTDALHHGEGLSLFFVDSVVRSYDGQIRVETPPEAGTVFTIELARASREA